MPYFEMTYLFYRDTSLGNAGVDLSLLQTAANLSKYLWRSLVCRNFGRSAGLRNRATMVA